MRYLTLIMALLLSMSVFAEISDHGSNSWDNTGTISAKDQVFINVKTAGAAIAAGTVVVASRTSDDGATVATSKVAATVPLCMVAEAIVADGQGKCQVKGYTDKLLFDNATTAVAGECIYISESTEGYSQATASSSVGGYDHCLGTFLDASAAYGAIEAYLNF